jgi:transposase InsO family protein
MKIHANARLTPHGRALMCTRVRDEGWSIADAAEAAGCSERTAYRWLQRFDAQEPMTDRSSAPHSVPGRTSEVVQNTIEDLRRLRWTSTRIAAELGMPTSTVCAVLQRIGLNRLWKLEPPEPPNRYCRRHPGELIHVDIKKFGRFDRPGKRALGPMPNVNRRIGWEFCHVAIDDTTRLAYVEILDDEKGITCAAFLRRAVAWFGSQGVRVQRVMSDNGSGYRSDTHRDTCKALNIKHIRTRPNRPRTNGKAERFIQTLQREWAYVAAYESSWQRRQALLTWLSYYNCRRPHSALGHKPPVSVLTDERS